MASTAIVKMTYQIHKGQAKHRRANTVGLRQQAGIRTGKEPLEARQFSLPVASVWSCASKVYGRDSKEGKTVVVSASQLHISTVAGSVDNIPRSIGWLVCMKPMHAYRHTKLSDAKSCLCISIRNVLNSNHNKCPLYTVFSTILS